MYTYVHTYTQTNKQTDRHTESKGLYQVSTSDVVFAIRAQNPRSRSARNGCPSIALGFTAVCARQVGAGTNNLVKPFWIPSLLLVYEGHWLVVAKHVCSIPALSWFVGLDICYSFEALSKTGSRAMTSLIFLPEHSDLL